MLRWIERLEVVGLEPLALAHRLSQRTTYSHVERLAGAGLVDRIYDRNGTLVAITRAGRRVVRPDIGDPRAAHRALANGALSAHARATSWIAVRLTLRGVERVSDREMRSQTAWQVPVIRTRPGHHRPDLGYVAGRTRVAIEVELTAKSAQRTFAIIAGYEHQLYTGRLGGLIYVTDHPGVRKLIERTAKRAHIDADRFRLMDFAEMKDETRQLAAETPIPSAPGEPSA